MREMKRRIIYSVFLVTAVLTISCQKRVFTEELSELRLIFEATSMIETKAGLEIPDTNRFILQIADVDGELIYDGLYGERPEQLVVKKGEYTVSVFSELFSTPAFSSPCWGDIRKIDVVEDITWIELVCRQTNSGVMVRYTDKYIEEYPNAVNILKNSEGELEYSTSESRIAYFLPGRLDFILRSDIQERKLFAKELEIGEILTLTVDSKDNKGESRITIEVDTTRSWRERKIVIGEDPDGSSLGLALPADGLLNWIGDKEKWVVGYIVGGDNTSSSTNFDPPFTSETNITIAASKDQRDRSKCVNVELKTASIKEALNLSTNPDNLGRKIYIKGDIEAYYFGITGVKSVKEFSFD